jgi:hypothetical protein
MAFKRHGLGRFLLPGGAVGAALDEAQRRNWLWSPRPGTGVITRDGVDAVRDFLGGGKAGC